MFQVSLKPGFLSSSAYINLSRQNQTKYPTIAKRSLHQTRQQNSSSLTFPREQTPLQEVKTKQQHQASSAHLVVVVGFLGALDLRVEDPEEILVGARPLCGVAPGRQKRVGARLAGSDPRLVKSGEDGGAAIPLAPEGADRERGERGGRSAKDRRERHFSVAAEGEERERKGGGFIGVSRV